LNQGLGLCAASLEAAARFSIDSDAWSTAEILAIVFPVVRRSPKL
jgi:hypothetical protein